MEEGTTIIRAKWGALVEESFTALLNKVSSSVLEKSILFTKEWEKQDGAEFDGNIDGVWIIDLR